MNCAELDGYNERPSRIENRGKEVAMNWHRVASRRIARRELIILGRRLVGKLLAMAILAVSITACSKTKEGDLEVEKPVIGTVTDTLNVPSVEVTTDSVTVKVPKVEVKK